MNRHRTPAMLAALVALAVALPAAFATDIYKWTDENGVVHFGDTPSGVPAEQVTHIESGPTDAARVRARVEARKASRNTADPDAAAGQEELTEEELRAQEEKRATRCAMLKERLQTYLTSRRLYREGENGERMYLDEEETLAARAKVQKEIVETCR